MSDPERAGLGRSLTVVVASYNGEETLAGILSTAMASPVVARVIVVDNDSSDGSPALAERMGAEVVRMDANRGYGAACNEGLSRSSTSWVAFCNQDVEAVGDMFVRLVGEAQRLRSESGADVIVAPRLESADQLVAETAHRLPTWREQAVELLAGSGAAGIRNVAGAASGGPMPCGWVSAACIVGSTVALRAVGGFDEAYFMYVEDVDLFERWRASGRLAFWVPDARAVHRGGQRPLNPQLHAIALANWVRYFARTTGPAAAVAIALAGLAGSLGRGIAWSLRARRDPQAGAYRRMFLRGALRAIPLQVRHLRRGGGPL